MSSLPVAPPRRRDDDEGPAEGTGREEAAAPRAPRLNAEGSACFMGCPRGIMLQGIESGVSALTVRERDQRRKMKTHQSSIKWSLPEPQLAQASTTLRFGGFGPLVSYTRH